MLLSDALRPTPSCTKSPIALAAKFRGFSPIALPDMPSFLSNCGMLLLSSIGAVQEDRQIDRVLARRDILRNSRTVSRTPSRVREKQTML